MSRNVVFRGIGADVVKDRGLGWGLPRVGAVAAIVGGGVMVAHEVWDRQGPGTEVGVVSSALHTTWVTLLFVAFAGLGALQRPSFGRTGRVATVLALAGSGGIAVLAVFETVSRAVSAPESGEGDPAPYFLVLIFAALGCYVVGGLLFGWATARARVLPRSAGVLLIIAMLLKMFVSDMVPMTLALMGAAFVWMGVTALACLALTAGPGRSWTG